jgi:hypothetical protein
MRDPVADDEVLAAVVELSDRRHGPSTSLITRRLAGDRTVTSGFQSAVRNSLQRLRARGELSCVMHLGTHRWGAVRESERSSA